MLFCFLIICVIMAAFLISFWNFFFAFTAWLSACGKSPSFWPISAFDAPSSLRLIISGFKVRDVRLFLTLEHLAVTIQFSCSVVSDSLQPHGPQHARPPCPSPTPRVRSLTLMSIESVMPSNHLILCSPLLLQLLFSQHQGLSSESALRIRWPKYWSFSFNISPTNEYPGLISFRMDWLDLLAVQGTLKTLLQHHSSKASIFWRSAFFTVQLSHPYMTSGKTIGLDQMDLCWQNNVSAF